MSLPDAGTGKLTPPRGYTQADVEERRQWLAGRTGVELPPFALDAPEQLQGLVENQIGAVGIPLSIAGPLLLRGHHANGLFYVPLCTLEGTLSLSMTRGMLAMYSSGGIETRHIRQEVSRSPVFIFEAAADADRFLRWVPQHEDILRTAAEATTRHGKLLRAELYPIHNRVILNLVYCTGEAAGQNMVTLASAAACRALLESFPAERPPRFLVESNFSGDKNPAYRMLLHGRGHHVIATGRVRGAILKRLMRTTAADMARCFIDITAGSQLAGVVGLNMHVANALAAIYLATGQDVACVAENACGICHGEQDGEDLVASLSMPSLTVGTVGGATRLHQQRANLELLGCTGPDSSKKLAEIICGAAFALELSLAGAIVSNEFAAAHAAFGRQKAD
jgi:hydroxymethylglutaryl-CoA reductase (NADPH)